MFYKQGTIFFILFLIIASIASGRTWFGYKEGTSIIVFPKDNQILLPEMKRVYSVLSYNNGILIGAVSSIVEWSCSPGWTINNGFFSPNNLAQTGWIEAEYDGSIHRVTVKVTNADSDGDGMPDAWELLHKLNPGYPYDAGKDYDDDGLTNLEEFLNGTDPWNPDSDNDGMSDGWEIQYGFNPLDPTDAGFDPDGDGFTNLEEYQNGTDPHIKENIRFVSLDGGHKYPFTSWETAAKNIQAAIDVANDGNIVLVNDGTYCEGSQINIAKPIILKSVNGQLKTIIDGENAYGCINITLKNENNNQAVVDGFTLTHGDGNYVGGNNLIKNCLITQNNGGTHGGGMQGGFLQNCTISFNSAFYGGGVCFSKIRNCKIIFNYANDGGGAYHCNIENSLIYGNLADDESGGVRESSLINCTISGNSSDKNAGGVYYAHITNCIIYYNFCKNGNNNYKECKILNTCASPKPSGSSNIGNKPEFINRDSGDFRLTSASPCINKGNNNYISCNTDLDGNKRIFDGTVDMGCYEHPGVPLTTFPEPPTISGPISVNAGDLEYYTTTDASEVTVHGTKAASVYVTRSGAKANIDQTLNGVVWTETISISATPEGKRYLFTYQCQTSDETLLSKTSTKLCLVNYSSHIYQPQTRYVSKSGKNKPPYLTWENAANTIQSAVDIAKSGDLILVTDGAYETTEMNNSRVYIDKKITVKSVNGADETIIKGADGIRCIYLSSEACLSGFTLTDATNILRGGGAYINENCGLSNCVIAENTGCDTGGGVYCDGGHLWNCHLFENSAVFGGGGYFKNALLEFCTINDNTGELGGGLQSDNSTLKNCIIYFNSKDNIVGSTENIYSCSPELTGSENISDDPCFVNHADGNIRLRRISPAINAGSGLAVVPGLNWQHGFGTDPDSIHGDADQVDIGFHYFGYSASAEDSDGNGMADWWELLHSVYDPNADPDNDGFTNIDEYRNDTDPNNPLPCLPYNTSFEPHESYTIGDLNQQRNWSATPGFTTVQDKNVFFGGQAVELKGLNSKASKYFDDSSVATKSTLHVYLSSAGLFPPLNLPEKASCVISFDPSQGIMALDGNGDGGGEWRVVPNTLMPDKWVEVTIIHYYNSPDPQKDKTWEIQIKNGGSLTSLGFKDNDIKALGSMSIKSGVSDVNYLDEIKIEVLQ